MSAQHTPGPEFDPHRAAIRAKGHSVNPYRIGMEVGERGEDRPNPYAYGSRGASLFREGVKVGYCLRRAKATGSAA